MGGENDQFQTISIDGTGSRRRRLYRRLRDADLFFVLLGLLVGVAILVGQAEPQRPQSTSLSQWLIAAYVIALGALLIYFAPRLIEPASSESETKHESDPIIATCRADLFELLLEYLALRWEIGAMELRPTDESKLWKRRVEGLGLQIVGNANIGSYMLDRAQLAAESDEHISFMRYFYKAVRQQIPIVQALDELESGYEGMLKGPDAASRKEASRTPESERMTDGGSGASDDDSPGETDDDGKPWFRSSADDEVGKRVQTMATRINAQIEDLSEVGQQKKIRTILGVSGTLTDAPTADEVTTATRFLHDEYIRNYESIKIIRTMITQLSYLLVVILVFGLVSSTLLSVFPLSGIDPMLSDLSFPALYVFVVFFGFFGAVVSNLFTFYNLSADVGPRIPDEEFQVTDEVVYARIFLGGAAAAVIYTLMLARFLPANLTGEQSLPLFVLALAFVAGFSDRLLVKALRMVEEQVLN